MTNTHFKPSIHGWPFGNSFTYSVHIELVNHTFSKAMGFCGGMCWTALQRFYGGTQIARVIPAPVQGSALYDEILNAQSASLPPSKVLKIYRWQCRPDQGHAGRGHSLGSMTKQEWDTVRDSIDNSHPVTLTIVEHSNDGDPLDLTDNHRVVAYAYEVRHLRDDEWVHGTRHAHIRAVTIYVYDPNFPYDPNNPHVADDVRLTFYTGCDDDWIGLKHNRGASAHGFFVDDQDRDYAFSDVPSVAIIDCVQTGINSRTEADYRLQFSWQCRHIPYFCIQVDSVNWGHNATATAAYEPAGLDDKQCNTRKGTTSIDIKVPRARCTLSVRLLGSDAFSDSIEVDAQPGIVCQPYVRSRAPGDGLEVCDAAIQDTDLFIKVPSPTDAEMQALDTSPFRWVMIRRKLLDTRMPQDDLTRASVDVVTSYRLGNINVPVFGNFVEKNLAGPIQLSATVTTFKSGVPTSGPTAVTPFNPSGQKLFDGFTNNPSDYDDDITVNFDYRARDRFGVLVQGTATFYGKSIVFEQASIRIARFDLARYARAEAMARYLMELGLIDTAIKLGISPPTHGPLPQPRPLDAESLINRLRRHQDLPTIINTKLKTLLGDSAIWKEVWKAQSQLLTQTASDAPSLGVSAQAGGIWKAAKETSDVAQRRYEPVAVDILASHAIDELRQDPAVIKKLAIL